MYSLTRVGPSAQALEEPVEHLVPPLAYMLPEDFDHPAEDDLTIDHPLWSANAERRFSENIVRNAILEAWRTGAMGSTEALYALLEHDAIDFQQALQLISDHAVAISKMDEVA